MSRSSITRDFLLTSYSLMAQSSNWLFTLNNPASVDIPKLWPDVKYAIWQAETGALGTPHLQGYVIFSKRKRIGGLKKISATAHWEIRRGTHTQAKEYCSKEETRTGGPWTMGEEPTQGKRTDLEEIAGLLVEGQTPKDLALSHPAQFIRNHRGIVALRAYLQKPRAFKTECFVIHGVTGVGKSRWANEHFPDAFWKSPNCNWWDSYDGEDTVVIDEFYGWLAWSELLRLCDRYPCMIQTKGGSCHFTSKRIIFLSNDHPSKWYSNPKCCWSTLERRLENIAEMRRDGTLDIEKGAFGFIAPAPDFFETNEMLPPSLMNSPAESQRTIVLTPDEDDVWSQDEDLSPDVGISSFY